MTEKAARPGLIEVDRLIDKDSLQAIGSLLLTAGTVEGFISLQLVRLTSGDKLPIRMALPLVAGMQIKVKLKILRLLIATQRPKAKTAVGKICKEIQDMFAKRDVFAHCACVGRDPKPGYFRFQDVKITDQGLLPAPQTFSAAEIRSYVDRLAESARALNESLEDLGFPPLSKVLKNNLPKK